jgi:hypothetical protein
MVEEIPAEIPDTETWRKYLIQEMVEEIPDTETYGEVYNIHDK